MCKVLLRDNQLIVTWRFKVYIEHKRENVQEVVLLSQVCNSVCKF